MPTAAKRQAVSCEHRPAERHRTPCERPCPSWQGWPAAWPRSFEWLPDFNTCAPTSFYRAPEYEGHLPL